MYRWFCVYTYCTFKERSLLCWHTLAISIYLWQSYMDGNWRYFSHILSMSLNSAVMYSELLFLLIHTKLHSYLCLKWLTLSCDCHMTIICFLCGVLHLVSWPATTENLSCNTALNFWAFHTFLNTVNQIAALFGWGGPFDIIAIVWMLIVNVEACKEAS